MMFLVHPTRTEDDMHYVGRVAAGVIEAATL